jgi:ATP-dependent protease ClpP protease subunit
MLMVLSLVLVTSVCKAGYDNVSVNAADAMIIEGVIAQGNILPLGAQMLTKPKGSTVDLIINSPGGEVTTGFAFVNLMEAAKANGVTIRCFVPIMAASMAFQILLHCNERHVLDKTFLLWHRARVMLGGLFGSPMRGPEMTILGHDLMRTDSLILAEVLAVISDMTEDMVSYHFENETLHIGSQLARQTKAVQAHESIPGLFEALLNKKLPRARSVTTDIFKPGQFIYMTNKVN